MLGNTSTRAVAALRVPEAPEEADATAPRPGATHPKADDVMPLALHNNVDIYSLCGKSARR